MSCKKTKLKVLKVPEEMLGAFSGLCTLNKMYQIIPQKMCNGDYVIPVSVLTDPHFQDIGNYLWGEESKPITEYLEEVFYYGSDTKGT